MTKQKQIAEMANTPEVKVGDAVHIFEMDGVPEYAGREGVVTEIGIYGTLVGTWGEYGINPTKDIFKKI